MGDGMESRCSLPHGAVPFYLTREEALTSEAIALAIDVSAKNNRIALDVIHALRDEVDRLQDELRKMRTREACFPCTNENLMKKIPTSPSICSYKGCGSLR